MTLINAIIVEDEAQSQILLQRIIEDYCPSLQCLGIASSASQASDLILKLKPDLVFLDVELGHENGFDLLDGLIEKSFKVIITTAYDQYAVKAFKYEAIDYILKPYNPKDIIKAVDKVKLRSYDQKIFHKLGQLINVDQESNKTKTLEVSTIDGVQLLQVNDILRIEASGSYSTIYLKEKKSLTLSKLIKEFEPQLPSNQFYRTHKSHLVNLGHVVEYKNLDGGYVLMNEKSQVPIARRRKDEFLSHWSKFKQES